jgi:dihydrodipicolinate synthase/N-acetylneuraminate lyase
VLRQRLLEGSTSALVPPSDEDGRVDVGCLERVAAESVDAGAAQGRLPMPDVRLPLTDASKPAVDDALAAITGRP